MTTAMICRKTMQNCPTPSMCAPFQGCQPERSVQPEKEGWICPRCKTVNAPFVPTCMNALCKPVVAAAAIGESDAER